MTVAGQKNITEVRIIMIKMRNYLYEWDRSYYLICLHHSFCYKIENDHTFITTFNTSTCCSLR